MRVPRLPGVRAPQETAAQHAERQRQFLDEINRLRALKLYPFDEEPGMRETVSDYAQALYSESRKK